MSEKICINCGNAPSLITRPICRECLNLQIGKQRRQRKDDKFPAKAKCPDCGTIKTDENCWRAKSGNNVGKFTTYCKPCSTLRRLDWDKKNLPKPGDVGYEDYVTKRKEYHKSLRQLPTYAVKSKKYDERRKTRMSSMKARLRTLMSAARTRSGHKGLAFELDLDFLLNLVEANNSSCCLTGIAFSLEPSKDEFTVNPYAPSIDKIDPKKGYVKDNVRLILTCVNIALNQFGEEFFTHWATEFVSRLSVK